MSTATPDPAALTPTEKVEALRATLQGFSSVLVAYSGGADSAYLLSMAAEVLGEKAVALTALSESMPAHEVRAAAALAESLGVRQIVIRSRELQDPSYVKNGPDRCFYCKNELYSLAQQKAEELGCEVVLDGTNYDDLGDHRPGRRAADLHGVRSLLVEVELTKAEIRSLSRERGLPTWDKPAAPCLASRIPTHTPVTRERLDQVGAAEGVVRGLGFRIFRVRHHGDVARIELAGEELPRALEPETRASLVEGVRGCGFRFVAVDLAGFRSGSLNIID